MRHPTIAAEYKAGQAWELIVKRWLITEGYVVRKSTPREDRQLDIDFWFRKHKHLMTSASLKTNHPKYYDSPFVFEEEQVRNGRVEDSWWRTGKAQVYFYLKRHVGGGGRLWIIDKELVTNYVSMNKWDAEKVGISEERLGVQALNNMGDSNLSLLLQSTVLREGLGDILFETSNLRQYSNDK